jgi:hypothetical protein
MEYTETLTTKMTVTLLLTVQVLHFTAHLMPVTSLGLVLHQEGNWHILSIVIYLLYIPENEPILLHNYMYNPNSNP